MDDGIIATLQRIGCIVEPCGSRVTCDPPPADTDIDYLVIMQPEADRVADAVNAMAKAGFQWEGGSEHYQGAASDFMSWRKDDVNLIVTKNIDFAHRHRAATWVCKKLNLMSKEDRIMLFQAVLYAARWENGHALPRGPVPADDFPF